MLHILAYAYYTTMSIVKMNIVYITYQQNISEIRLYLLAQIRHSVTIAT